MTIYNGFPDVPNQIKAEGSQIALVFTRTDATSGVLTWNIPSPAAGCAANTRAYNGMLITGGLAAETTADKPIDGTRYVGDPTMDSNLSMGSKIGSTMVVVALYNDITTSSAIVTGLTPTGNYFFNAHPMDNTSRYYYDGTHSYSLPDNDQILENSIPGIQKVGFPSAITLSAGTGLLAGTQYTFAFKIDGKQYSFVVDGVDAQTYQQLIDQLNAHFEKSVVPSPFVGTSPPNTGSYYFDSANQKLFLWDGHTYTQQTVFIQATAPNALSIGDHWYKPTDQLYQWDGSGWVLIANSTIIKFLHDPTVPVCDDIWFNGTIARQWNGTVWCENPTYLQTPDPTLALVMTCADYWFDSQTQFVKQWTAVDVSCSTDVPTNATTGFWTTKTPVFSPYDPHTPTTGALWYNDVAKKLYTWSGTDWDELVLFASPNPPLTPAADQYWYDIDDHIFYQRNAGNTTWIVIFVTTFGRDFTIETSCDLWLNSGTNVLKVWDTVNSVWTTVANFVISSNDPSLAPILAKCSIWIDPVTKIAKKWEGSIWETISYINFPTNPITAPDNTTWLNTTTNTWNLRTAGAWAPFIPTISESDPSSPAIGTLWFNTSDSTLRRWNGASWIQIAYSSTSVIPQLGDYWFNPATNTLHRWNNIQWIDSPGIATASIDEFGQLVFTTTSVGSTARLEIQTPIDVYQLLIPPGSIQSPNRGQDEVLELPGQQQLGVGTDGTADEKRSMINVVKQQLGYPVIQVELTTSQMEMAVDNALQELRMKSSASLRRDFFILRGKPGQHEYTLSDKTTGLNRITSIMKITRQRSGPFGGSDNQIFAQRFAQEMWQMSAGFDLISVEAYAQYTQLVERMFSSDIQFLWNERTRKIRFLQPLRSRELLLLECATEKTEQELLKDRFLANWLQDYTRAECLEMLSRIRGKYSQIPGPNGGVSLNGPELYQQAVDLRTELGKELDDWISSDPEGWLGEIMIG